MATILRTAPLPRPTGKAASARHLVGLDGLRGLAVLAVIGYHFFPAAVPGGFLGVDVFFVISGFLITYLLIEERRRLGHIRLGRFWDRRARRLLPALASTVLVCGTIAAMIGGDTLVGIGRQVLGATTFSSNWIAAFTGESYFSADTPDLFRNFWSLAVEEQFYLIWPLALILLLRLRRTSVRMGVMALVALASASEMALVFRAGSDASRVYYGTDTHSFGLAVGTILAFWLADLRRAPAVTGARDPAGATPLLRERIGLPAERWLPWAGLGAFVLVGVAVFLLPDTATVTYRGGILAVSVATAVVIWAAVAPGSRLGRLVDAPPLRVVGERSYGIYLWHWPLFVVTTAAFGAGEAGQAGPLRLPVAVVALAATGLAAALSYRYVEQPIRKAGLRATAKVAWHAVRRPAENRLAMILVTVTAVCVAATATGIVHAPSMTRAQMLVQQGEEALAHASSATTGPAAGDGGKAPTPHGRASAAPASTAPAAPPVLPVSEQPPPPPWRAPMVDGRRPLPSGDQITAVGDSVMLASAPALTATFPGISVDAKVSRQMQTAPGILSGLRARGDLRPVIVIGLGTNGAIAESTLDRIAAIAGTQRRLVFVTVQAPRGWSAEVNGTLTRFADDHPGTVALSAWQSDIAGHLGLLAPDKIHPGEAGGKIYADALQAALQQVVDAPSGSWFLRGRHVVHHASH